MKHLRKFPDAATRDAVLASINYGVLSYTTGAGVKIKTGGSGPEPVIDTTIPFYVENITDETETLTFTCYESNFPITIETSTDTSNWETLGTIGLGDPYELTAQLQPNDKLYIRATANSWCDYFDDEGYPVGCTISGISKVGGNIMSLLYGSSFTGNETTFPSNSTGNFAGLFSGTDLINASELILPAITLTEKCYRSMFYCCSSLTTAPALPATTLTGYCYAHMFESCSSLATAPALPATTLAGYCYEMMFESCSSLTTAPALPATTLTTHCYRRMFESCSSLTTAPALPATTLADFCYESIFEGCYSLNYIKCLATDKSASSCTYNWVSNVASTGTFVKDANATWPTGESGIPSGWTVQDAA